MKECYLSGEMYTNKIVSMGRGGSGKTSFVALVTKYLIEKGAIPILLVDVDPDLNLAEMVGIDFEEQQKKTISELLIETFLERGGTTVGIPPSERIESRILAEGMYEGDFFDLIAVGTKYIEGCYCLPDASLKSALERLTKTYKYVLIDSPAGLEHLNRRIAPKVDDIFDIIDPSQKSFEHMERAYKVAKECKIDFKNFYIVGGYRFPENLGTEVKKRTNLEYLGKIAYDKDVEDYVLSGKSLLELSSSSSAYKSVEELMKKAGH
jgi:CO dehydrogenase maturation factor